MSSVCGFCLCKDGHMGPCPHQEIERLRAENKRLELALAALCNKLDAVHADEKYASVWFVSQLHQGPYGGPTYTEELVAAKAALAGKEQENASSQT